MRDSVTVDEPSHLVSGYAALAAGDHRLSPDHPPLGRLVLALPLLTQTVSWRAEGTEAWRRGDFFTLGRSFFEEWNDGQRMVRPSRAVAVALLLAFLLTIGAVTRALFGPGGALIAMTVAAFDPALLAHGHLATLDVPFSLLAILTLFCADRWLARPTAGRLALLAAAFAASTLVKFSWFALVPALAGMALVAHRPQRNLPARSLVRTLATGTAALALAATFGIWAAYGFRFAAAAGGDAASATMHVVGDFGRPLPTTPAGAWESVLHDPATGADRPGLVVPLLRVARSWRLLPEAYLYGSAYVQKKAGSRAAYLRGRYSANGFPDYFPWAFAVKTPLPTLLLVSAGLATALLAALRGSRPSPLAVGLALFALVYLAALGSSGLNIGYRHLLPALAILAIATGGLSPERFPKRLRLPVGLGAGGALLWLVLGTWSASPRLLGYFNEAAGGWRKGHLFLADSNLDWGQDLLRLEERLRTEPPGGRVWLSQASDPPLPRGLAVRWFLGEGSHAPSPEPISGGLYVISATDLLGVYRPLARVSSWRDRRLIARYEAMAEERGSSGETGKSPTAIDAFEALRRLKLLSRLAQREPDERVGTSLFLFRLSDAQVAEATGP
ncbi:MAG: glycosyltransferase family 39 protein [Holophagales bacterium]|nr:glycosyltransferase family 39 protein [Holophagales bacterium]